MRRIFMLIGILYFANLHAFTCFFSFVKDSCWKDYAVTVVATDILTGKEVVTVTIDKGQMWSRKEFTCHSSQSFEFISTFTPVIWDKDAGKKYPGKSSWTLPAKIDEGKTAWNLTVCFPKEFSEVPVPPTSGSECKCMGDTLPPVDAPKKQS